MANFFLAFKFYSIQKSPDKSLQLDFKEAMVDYETPFKKLEPILESTHESELDSVTNKFSVAFSRSVFQPGYEGTKKPVEDEFINNAYSIKDTVAFSPLLFFNIAGFLASNPSDERKKEFTYFFDSELKDFDDLYKEVSKHVKNLNSLYSSEFKSQNFIFYRDEIVWKYGLLNKINKEMNIKAYKFKYERCNLLKALMSINDVVKKETGSWFTEKVSYDFFKKPIIFVNTVTLNATWENKFNRRETKDGEFNGAYEKIKTKMLCQTGLFKMYDDEQGEILEMKLMLDNKPVSFFVLVPQISDSKLRITRKDALKRIAMAIKHFDTVDYEMVTVKMPAIKCSTITDISKAVRFDGFDETVPDFLDPSTEKGVLKGEVSYVTKFQLDINENGFGNAKGTVRVPERIRTGSYVREFIVDKPFVGVIFEKQFRGFEKMPFEACLMILKFFGPQTNAN